MTEVQLVERKAMTIVELLIVVAIITLLLQIALPAVEMAREKARMLACANNLRQVGVAFQMHEASHKHLPTNGWGYLWVGDPDRGFGREQPGGWIFNTLPYIEHGDVREMSAGLPSGSEEKKAATARMLQTAIAGLNCPSRRLSRLIPCHDPFEPYNSDPVLESVRSDYAANGGDIYCDAKSGMGKGPASFEDAVSAKWSAEFARLSRECNGIVHPQSVVGTKDITDGTAHTYLAGEKRMIPDHYVDGRGTGDQRSLYIGSNAEINRWAASKPMGDIDRGRNNLVWGASHLVGLNMVFCDGSVRVVNYDIDGATHRRLGNRRDDEIAHASGDER